jgi:FAD/FMN-containing dehydrogenase
MTATARATVPSAIAGPVFFPGDPGYGEEVSGFNLINTHTPEVVVGATSSADVAAAVRWAASAGMPVAVQATGHGANYRIDSGLLVSTQRMNRIEIDPIGKTATVGAGVRWRDLLAAAAPHGLAGLNGSSSTVGIVGYTVGGGLPVLGRAYGWAADRVRSAEVVTADGQVRRVDPASEPELFWALRGGKGTVGIVTELTFELVTVARFYGGGIYFAGEHGPALFDAFSKWTPSLPEHMCATVSFLRLPPLPTLPEPLRGQFLAHVGVAYVGDPAEGARLLAPMRSVAPAIIDGVDVLSYTDVDRVFDDPHDPLPAREQASLLRELSADAVRTIEAAAGPGRDLPVLKVEVRHLGGALARRPALPDAVNGREAAYLLETVGVPLATPPEAVEAAARALHASMAPFGIGTTFVNLHGRPGDLADRARAWSPETYQRLQRVKRTFDPQNLLSGGHSVAA